MNENNDNVVALLNSPEIRNLIGYNNQPFNLNHIFQNGNTLLTAAIKKSDLTQVMNLLREGSNVNQREEGGATPLLLAIHLNREKIVELLLRNHADANKGDSYDTPLTAAVRKGNLKIIKNLIEKNAVINITNIEGMSPIFWSIQEEEVEILKLLISQGIPKDAKNAAGDSPLIAAVKDRASKEIFQCLLANGATISQPAMTSAASKGHLEAIKVLINNGADGNMIASDDNSLIAIAVRYRQFEVVKYLTNLDVNICKVGQKGKTPLLWAIENEDLETIEWLLSHGAFYIINSVFLNAIKTKNVNVVHLLYSTSNDTLGSPGSINLVAALDEAFKVESFDIAKYLLNCGATLTSLGANETMYLISFLEKKNHEMVELLIENGAKLNNSYSNFTPLTKAVAVEDFKMTTKLISHGADVNLRNPQALTPLAVAARAQNFQLFQYLVQSGANIDNDPSKHDSNLCNYYRTAKEQILKQQQQHLGLSSNQESEAAEEEEQEDEVVEEAESIEKVVEETESVEKVVEEKSLAEKSYYVIEFD